MLLEIVAQIGEDIRIEAAVFVRDAGKCAALFVADGLNVRLEEHAHRRDEAHHEACDDEDHCTSLFHDRPS